jgi:hypothetical protein
MTFSRNKPPSKAGLTLSNLEFGQIRYETGPNEFFTTFGTGQRGQRVVKAGRSSTTSGFMNRVQREVNWQNQAVSMEYEVIENAADFAQGGDSGSWVVNEKKELVGIVIGSDTKCGDWGCDLVTPTHEILEDITLKTVGQILLHKSARSL